MAKLDSETLFLSIAELTASLRERTFSARDLTRLYLDRLEELGPRYHALALLLRKDAMRKAKDVDDDLKIGRFRSMLQGIPYGAKDLLSVAGHVTTWGAKPYAAQKFEETATILNRLDKAGAILAGKLAMVQLAGGGGYRYAAASMFGPGLNPWNVEYWSGGSSSGSGSAVAAGLVPFALGSETWGSILTPSAYCGVTGLRPTYGLVSRHGAMALSWTLDKIGPMCRSAEDCGHVLQTIAGGDAEDPGSAGKSFYYTPQYAPKMETLRVGFAPVDFAEWAAPPARPVFQQALEVIRSLGVTLVETKLPDLPYGVVTSTIIAAEAASIFEPLIRSGGLDQLDDARQAAGLKAALDMPARDYLKAMRLRRVIQEEMRKTFAGIDVLVTYSRSGPATKVSEALDTTDGRPVPADRGLSGLSAAGNLAGWPALSLPCGFVQGLPVALSLVSRPFTENTILLMGREFQKRTEFHRQRPPNV